MIKFYKESNGLFVLGSGDYSYVSPGQFYSKDDGIYLTIYNAQTDKKEFDSPYSEYVKKNGTPYSSLAELIEAIYEVFLSSGSGSGFGVFEIIGANGILTDWALPEDANIDKAIIGLNPMQVEVIALLVGGVKTVRFATAPASGDLPNIIYNKI